MPNSGQSVHSNALRPWANESAPVRIYYDLIFPEETENGYPQSLVIDAAKGATPLVILLTIMGTGMTDNPTLWTYFGLHGCYGVCRL
jgi:hypothetical protein